ncbi:cbb3-type cytochrome c oxidase subunit I [Rubricoccus marinus]|uniref:cbb3-type cytochrome c oxidase subunit I n=1 Tax=Rubricoccus marinus TaxID=716817 RepID=UPI000B987C21|nr:cbb3-type cytochrome c oxidase subunit I [Rubricoccus marinus]
MSKRSERRARKQAARLDQRRDTYATGIDPVHGVWRDGVAPTNVATWRRDVDRHVRTPVVAFTLTAVFWLLVGTTFALIASFKFQYPDWMGETAAMTFGRVRPAHLNTMIWGWISPAGVAIAVWLWGRLLKTEVRHVWALNVSWVLWNIGVTVGTVGILAGYSQGIEWVEMPLAAFVFLVPALLLVAYSLLSTLRHRRVAHLYISVWYIGASLLWTPVLIVAILLPIYSGVPHATANWWFAHNILGLWLTPIGLGAAYYLIPKVVGRPIYSYHLSYLGFWTLALFYNWAGVHHLVGGPPPQWVVTVSIVFSVMMIIPVIIVGLNHHMTAFPRIKRVIWSPTLRFVVFGAVSYTVVSLQGAMQALRFWQEVTHFTHYTIAHSHIGVYAFVTMIAYGALYYLLPRVTGWEWKSKRLISLHFWTTAVGISLYIVGLTAGGVLQGFLMNNPDVPFMEIVETMKPFLWSRSIAGVLMTVGHLAFAYLVWEIVRKKGERPPGPVFFRQPPAGVYRMMTGADPDTGDGSAAHPVPAP